MLALSSNHFQSVLALELGDANMKPLKTLKQRGSQSELQKRSDKQA